MQSIFVSKSILGNDRFVSTLSEALDGQFECHSQDEWRYSPRNLSYHEEWTTQFQYTRKSSVIVVLLTGQEKDKYGETDLSVGQDIETFDAIWRGTPVIWCGITYKGQQIASKWQTIMKKNHPCLISHQVDVLSNYTGRLELLAQLCLKLSTVSKPSLPERFNPCRPQRLRHQVCEATPEGWQPKDLSAGWFQPKLRVWYGEHLIKSPYLIWCKSPSRQYDLSLEVTDPSQGLIEGEIALDREGVGQLRLIWTPALKQWGYSPQLHWGSEILHWDFTCGNREDFC